MKNLPLVFVVILFFHVSVAQMVSGEEIPEFRATFNVQDPGSSGKIVDAYLIDSSVPSNILWSSDSLQFTIQIDNKTNETLECGGYLHVVAYGTRGRPGDIWIPEMFRIGEVDSVRIQVTVPPNGFANLKMQPHIPRKNGAYGIVTDLGKYGRQFITSCVRTFSFPFERIQYPSFCLDDISNDVLQRLGVHAIRHGVEYHPTFEPDFEIWYQAEKKRLEAYNKSGVAVLVKMSAPVTYSKIHPLGVPRPWLDENGVMQNTKCDMAWMPQYDEDFKKVVYRLASEFGWPKGPINAFALWNEPWEGMSISGWGADMERYREIYTKMAEGVEEARRDAGVDILIGGGSSTSNALDKLFADGKDTFLDRFDFCSIHYQGLSSNATIKKWHDRKSPRGRVKIWDTESWVANVDDRVATVVAADRSAGYDRAMGVFMGNICDVRSRKVLQTNGLPIERQITHAWSVAASIGAVTHFVGERKFKEILFKNGLPWIYVFEGLNGDKEDGTLVIVGDIGEEFGAENVLFRTARGLSEVAHEQDLRQEISKCDPERQQHDISRMLRDIDKNEILKDAFLSFNSEQDLFRSYDFYGNQISLNDGQIVIPLDGRGFFVRSNGTKGSFDKLLEAVRYSRITGIEPLETIVHDFTTPLAKGSELKLRLTNVLNRPVKGILTVAIPDVQFDDQNSTLSFAAHETRIVTLKVKSFLLNVNNSYPVRLKFDAGGDGISQHDENVHVNIIAKRKIDVDGKLDDWKDVFPQAINNSGGAQTSLTEAAWFPFKNFKEQNYRGSATTYQAYDKDNFYFAAKVIDDSIDEGMRRFETLDSDNFFYPQKSLVPTDAFRFGGAMKHNGNSYSIRYAGLLKPDYSEEYSFHLNAKGHAKLWIDDSLILESNNEDVVSERVRFKKGHFYKVRLEFSKEWGDAALSLSWSNKHVKKEIIPASRLFSPTESKGVEGLEVELFYGPDFNVFASKRLEKVLDFTCQDGHFPDSTFSTRKQVALYWPEGVRRYSYRRDTETPFGNFPDHDNVQIAFNVLSDDSKDLYPFPEGTMKGYTNYQCTDYEYALNPVAELYGGGTEIWRSKVPGMPHKHFFPRQPRSPFDGPVKGASLVIKHEGNIRVVEAAIPWTEIPEVKKRMDKHQKIKFTARINDNTPHGCMELAYGRSVSKINGSFKVDWKEHWANELEFSFE